MVLNPFFLQGSSGEQSLVQDLINEQLQMYGVEVYYIPRKYMKTNTVIREVIESKFDNSYPIEAYVDNYDGYADNSVFLSKFGVQATNELTVSISRERFEDYISPLMKNLPNVELSTRPKEGDLVYFPLGDRLFEIKFVEHEKPFYQLKKLYIYTLRCELFRPEDEILDTGIEEIDDTTEVDFNLMSLTVVTTGVQAEAVTGFSTSGAVGIISVTTRGEKYSAVPTVAISSAPSGGKTAVGIATLLSGLVNCDGTEVGSKVQGIEISNPGFGYSVAPGLVVITADDDAGKGAEGVTHLANGAAGIVTITNAGSGYVLAPSITFSSPGIGTTAIAHSIVSSAGSITAIRYTNAGAGYTVAPTITISAPDGVGTGDYIFNETVTGSTSNVTAIVKGWNATTGVIDISNASGDFIAGENITGSESSAVHQLKVFNQDNTVNQYPDNDNIEVAADAILDFSEKNPFGTP